jgi:hypothetical protein
LGQLDLEGLKTYLNTMDKNPTPPTTFTILCAKVGAP